MQFSHSDSDRSPQMSHQVDGNDAKYVSRLSTILVATIQETKDRISQIEYIFCSQLYPNFQKNSKGIQDLYAEAREAAEVGWKARVNELELQLKEVCMGKERAIEDFEAVKLEKSKLVRRVAELEGMLLQKTKEVDEGMELHGKLLDLVETKNVVVIDKEKQMKEHADRMNHLLDKLQRLEKRIEALNQELQEKNEEVTKSKELREELTRQIESQTLQITSNEKRVIYCEKEKKQLAELLEFAEANSGGLKNEMRRKTVEVEEAKQLYRQLVEQLDRNGIELTEKNQLLSSQEKEKQILLSKMKYLENKVEEFQENLRNAVKETPNVRDLAKQLEQKNAELSAEVQSRRNAVSRYKKIKSQQIFLLKKLHLSDEDMVRQIKEEGESDILSNENENITLPEMKKINPVSDVVAGALNKVKKEVDSMDSSEDEKTDKQNQMSGSHSLSSSKSPAAINLTTKRNAGSSAGVKRRASGWRETRSRQNPGGADPHDDFLDTPLENIRGNIHNTRQHNLQNVAHISKEVISNSSDDETQDMKLESGPEKQQLKAPKIGPKDIKYVEPVRKKSEREKLNGIECKQCKKFYDAVLCDAGDNNGEINKQNLRCEHHDGVSRHRYRYIPPMTPEGFWNIGFDTES